MDPDPISRAPPGPMRTPVFIQAWEPCVFIHWPADIDAVTALLPPGCTADTYEGQTYVGLIPLVIRRVQVFGGRPVRHVSTFTELNVRIYSVDAEGRRGIVFLSLDAERLVPVLAAQASYRLPYKWARMSYENTGDVHRWTSVRRWPGPVGARAKIDVRVGAVITERDGLTASSRSGGISTPRCLETTPPTPPPSTTCGRCMRRPSSTWRRTSSQPAVCRRRPGTRTCCSPPA